MTVDRISGGRLLLGLGSGWSPEGYDAVGVPMRERGDRLDECLDVLRAWWHDDPVQVEGGARPVVGRGGAAGERPGRGHGGRDRRR